MAGARATVHGAVSIVNAIATGSGATLGIGLEVEAAIEARSGAGISIQSENKSLSSRLIRETVERMVPRRELDRNRIVIELKSEIPTGYGLKSSSAISSAVALGCARIFRPSLSDQRILLAGVEASIGSGVSITGAYDDACSCYYGGFNVTDNTKRKRVAHEKCPAGLSAIIFIPRDRRRGKTRRLGVLSSVFGHAWERARVRDYWGAMTINGLAAASALGRDAGLVAELVEKGALGASMSGNGPSIAAVARRRDENSVRKVFSAMEGRIIVSRTSNRKAAVHDM